MGLDNLRTFHKLSLETQEEFVKDALKYQKTLEKIAKYKGSSIHYLLRIARKALKGSK